MTPEELDLIKKLARDPNSAAFHDCMARQTIPLVKALREARAEVERLREVVRQVHGLVARVQIDWDSGLNRLICNIRDITKGKEQT